MRATAVHPTQADEAAVLIADVHEKVKHLAGVLDEDVDPLPEHLAVVFLAAERYVRLAEFALRRAHAHATSGEEITDEMFGFQWGLLIADPRSAGARPVSRDRGGDGRVRRFGLTGFPHPRCGKNGSTKTADEHAAIALRLPAVPTSVPATREAVKRWCAPLGAGRDPEIALAVTEVVANVVRHAYPRGSGEFEVCADLREGELSITVRDWGVGLQRRSPSGGLGVGMTLIRTLADSVGIDDCEPGTLVSMRFSRRRAQTA